MSQRDYCVIWMSLPVLLILFELISITEAGHATKQTEFFLKKGEKRKMEYKN